MFEKIRLIIYIFFQIQIIIQIFYFFNKINSFYYAKSVNLQPTRFNFPKLPKA